MLRAFDETDARPLPGPKAPARHSGRLTASSSASFGDNDLKKVNVSGEYGRENARHGVSNARRRPRWRHVEAERRDHLRAVAADRVVQRVSRRRHAPRGHDVGSREHGNSASMAAVLAGWATLSIHGIGRRPEDGGVYMASLDSPAGVAFSSDPLRTVFAPPGFLLFARDGSLFAQRFDPSSGRLDDAPRTIASVSDQNDVMISAAANQTSLHRRQESTRELAWYDRSGRLLTKVTSETCSRRPYRPMRHAWLGNIGVKSGSSNRLAVRRRGSCSARMSSAAHCGRRTAGESRSPAAARSTPEPWMIPHARHSWSTISRAGRCCTTGPRTDNSFCTLPHAGNGVGFVVAPAGARLHRCPS